ncbi:hypothetical protein KC348_g8608 [Hortaea werneckii]|uniref:Uncharacterized protein n=1 Tax=Hortaea werneckii EXF-2000 TaxID=1157616 RepID=A0A1Z5TT57_HORWE|nr:hypothetical protein KC358_g11867 [Hortaea werneckii]OTA39111.1 hypothetical protein BTJ68_00863 [Hortaea werneckii EXF-2000]KAI6926631.1 hypothetical protein KC348_g8608 [Hortaea werneckii]KAI6933825.1 hypothetical protein KC341_g8023 [Hortaea werneckii]KAI6961877.1 hypothetical protein KC321_g12078 [Hortaea werneckii]
MTEPPPYEEAASAVNQIYEDQKSGFNGSKRFSIREEVVASRSQHVAALVSKILPHVRERARSGFSRSTLLLLPSDQGIDCEGQLVGFAEDEMPLMIQLEGRHDLSEFWQQQEAIALLQEQTLNAVSDSKVLPPVQTLLPPREQPVLASDNRSLLGSKSKSPQMEQSRPSVQMPPATVSVNMEEVYFRTENAYGLMETLRRNALLLAVQVNC